MAVPKPSSGKGPHDRALNLPNALQIGKVRGIPIRLHWTFLLVLPFFAVLMGSSYFTPTPGRLDQLDGPALGWGAALAVTLFACVTLHELSHSLVALRYGIKVRSITLLPIGGVSQMEEMPKEPRREFLVSLAGPLTNFVLAAPILAWGYLGGVPDIAPRFGDFVRLVGSLNLVLGAFNLFLPAFPMDGGRILRAILASKMGLLKATHYAASAGRALAFAMAIFGLFSPTGGGFFLLIIALFIYMGATEEERAVQVNHTLGDLRVRDVMTSSPVILRPEDSLEDVFRIMVESKHVGFPVVDAMGRVVGFLGLKELAGIDQARFATTPVRLVMRPQVPTVAPAALATDALRAMGNDGADYLVVLDHGQLAGLLSKTDLTRVVSILAVRGGGKAEDAAL